MEKKVLAYLLLLLQLKLEKYKQIYLYIRPVGGFRSLATLPAPAYASIHSVKIPVCELTRLVRKISYNTLCVYDTFIRYKTNEKPKDSSATFNI